MIEFCDKLNIRMYLIFDIGGTNMRIATSLDGKTINDSAVIPTPQDFEAGLQAIKQTTEQLTNGHKVKAVIGGIAGPLDKEKTMLIASPHIGGWVQKPLKSELEKIFNSQVFLEHEADLEGLGEATSGAGQGHRIVAVLIIGTGIATTRIVDGKIDKNALGFEAGHQIIVPNGNLCDCGGKGHLEAYVSGSGLKNTYGKRGEEIKDPAIWDGLAKYLATGLNNVTVFWSPDIIVLGGPVMRNIPMDAVRTYFKQVLTIFPTAPRIEAAKLGDMVGLNGALAYIRQLGT